MVFVDAVADQSAALLASAILTSACIYLGVFGFFIVMFWNIFSKAGFSGARAFLMLIPIVNLIIIIMFAFGEWPMRRELEMLRMQAQMGQGPVIQQISLSAGAPQVMYPQQPPVYPPPQPYPPQSYPQQPSQYPPQYPQT